MWDRARSHAQLGGSGRCEGEVPPSWRLFHPLRRPASPLSLEFSCTRLPSGPFPPGSCRSPPSPILLPAESWSRSSGRSTTTPPRADACLTSQSGLRRPRAGRVPRPGALPGCRRDQRRLFAPTAAAQTRCPAGGHRSGRRRSVLRLARLDRRVAVDPAADGERMADRRPGHDQGVPSPPVRVHDVVADPRQRAEEEPAAPRHAPVHPTRSRRLMTGWPRSARPRRAPSRRRRRGRGVPAVARGTWPTNGRRPDSFAGCGPRAAARCCGGRERSARGRSLPLRRLAAVAAVTRRRALVRSAEGARSGRGGPAPAPSTTRSAIASSSTRRTASAAARTFCGSDERTTTGNCRHSRQAAER